MRLRGRKAGAQLWLGFSLDSGNNKELWNCSKKGDIIITFVFLKDHSGLQYREQTEERQGRKYKD